jgi:hypothetical protein
MRGERDEIEKCRFNLRSLPAPGIRGRFVGYRFVGTIVPMERHGYELLTRA